MSISFVIVDKVWLQQGKFKNVEPIIAFSLISIWHLTTDIKQHYQNVIACQSWSWGQNKESTCI